MWQKQFVLHLAKICLQYNLHGEEFCWLSSWGFSNWKYRPEPAFQGHSEPLPRRKSSSKKPYISGKTNSRKTWLKSFLLELRIVTNQLAIEEMRECGGRTIKVICLFYLFKNRNTCTWKEDVSLEINVDKETSKGATGDYIIQAK